MNKSLLSTVLLVPLLISCGQSNEIGSFRAVDASGWNYGDTIFFDVATPDSVFQGDVLLTVRNSSAYTYSNLWVEISYPLSDSFKSDTVNFRLADTEGNWLGRGLGLSFQRTDTVGRNISLKSPARIGVRHIMRSDKIQDIEQLGITLIPSNSKHE